MVGVIGRYAQTRHPEKSLADLQRILDRARQGGGSPAHRAPVRNIRRRLGQAAIDELIARYQAGAPTTQLMADYSISKSAVLRLLKEASVAMRRQPLTEQQVQQARQLRATGMSIADVATKLGLARESVRRVAISCTSQDN